MQDRDELVQTRITASELKTLKSIAASRGISIADALRESIARLVGGRYARFWCVPPDLVKETFRQIRGGIVPNGALDVVEWKADEIVGRIHLNRGVDEFSPLPESVQGLTTWFSGSWRRNFFFLHGNPEAPLWEIANVIDVASTLASRPSAMFWLRKRSDPKFSDAWLMRG